MPGPRSLSRRTLLRILGGGTVFGLSGCLGLTSLGCERNEVVVDAFEVPSSTVESDNLVLYDELPEEEQALIREAVADRYHKCAPNASDIPQSVESLADRSNDIRFYVKYNESYYALSITIWDEVVAVATDPNSSS